MKYTKEERIIHAIALGADVFVFMNKGVCSYKDKEIVMGDALFWRLVRRGVIKETFDPSGRVKHGWGPVKSKALEISGIINTKSLKEL